MRLSLRIGTSAVVVALATVAIGPAHAGTLYGITRSGVVFTVDQTTGVGTMVCTASLNATEIEFDPATGTGVLQVPDGGFQAASIDLTTCTTGTPVGNAHSFTGLEYVGTTLYGATIDSGGGTAPSSLRTLDPTTGMSTLIGPTNVNAPLAGLAYDAAAQVMYGIAGGPTAGDLYTVDLTTGAATSVGNTGLIAGSLEFGNGGALFAGGANSTNKGEIWTIDKTTGAGTKVGDSGFADGITGLAFVPACGDGVLDVGEACDDGAANGTAASCCTVSCQLQPSGTACASDGEPCTRDACDGAGQCTHAFPVDAGCQAAATGKSMVLLKQGKSDSKDRLAWRWKSAAAVAKSDFGSPTAGTATRLCIADASGVKVSTTIPGGTPWKETGKGFTYKNKSLTPGGILLETLVSGKTGKIAVQGKGANLALPTLPLATPVTVRLQRSDAATCWEAVFGAAKKNTAALFKAKSN